MHGQALRMRGGGEEEKVSVSYERGTPVREQFLMSEVPLSETFSYE